MGQRDSCLACVALVVSYDLSSGSRLGSWVSMARSGRAGVLGVFVLINHVLGHWNSEVNLSEGRRLLEQGTDESINAKWQCEPQSEKV